MACDVTVIGGGAAGLVAAITAAEAGASVVVLERELACGRSILATGNGRCNFANVHLDPRRLNDPAFVEAVCGPHWLDDVLAFFRQSGLRWCIEGDRLYPMSRQASSVRNVLLTRARRAGVVLAPARELRSISWMGPERLGELGPATHWDPSRSEMLPAGMAEVAHTTPDGNPEPPLSPCSRTVILASGGAPLPRPGDLGLAVTRRVPVLCPLACEPSPLIELDGRRAHVQACLTKAGSSLPSWHERGEVLFRSYGISGILAFDLSRRAGEGDLVELDLLPDLGRAEVRQLADPLAGGNFEPGCLDGVLDPLIARLLERLARESWHVGWPGRDLAPTCAEALVALAKTLPLLVVGTTETDRAQVTRGGLANGQFDPKTLACHAHPWLFACGEALDVDGDCGGYNLGWAWKSGMVAGAAAARWALS